jgi:Lrp/AsnC family leucine-responsive transcriptional regulator
MFELDAFDKRLLQLLQQNCRMTASELGEIVGLSSSAVQRRLGRLREERIIEAEVAIVSPAVAELGITCIVDIVLEEGHARALESFKATMQQCSEVMQCYYVTGTYDFVLVVNAKDMQEYETFTRKWLVDNPHLKHFYTHVVMDRVKVGYSIPL